MRKPIVSLGGKFDRSNYSSDEEWYKARLFAFTDYCDELEETINKLKDENSRLKMVNKQLVKENLHYQIIGE